MRALKIAVLLVVISISIFGLYVLYMYFHRFPGVIDLIIGKSPEFSVTLVDNGENDYVDLQYIRPGTDQFERDRWFLGGMPIEIRPMEVV